MPEPFFLRSLIRAHTGSRGKSCVMQILKLGQILLSKNRSWVLVDTHNIFFWGSLIRACTGSFANVLEAVWPVSIKLGQILCCPKTGHRP